MFIMQNIKFIMSHILPLQLLLSFSWCSRSDIREYITGGAFRHVVTVTYKKNGLRHISPTPKHILLQALHGRQMIDDKFAAIVIVVAVWVLRVLRVWGRKFKGEIFL